MVFMSRGRVTCPPSFLILMNRLKGKKKIKRMDITKLKISVLIFTTFILFISMNAQDPDNTMRTRPKNNLSLNVLGDVALISGNYERIVPLFPQFLIVSKIGLGYNENILRWLYRLQRLTDT